MHIIKTKPSNFKTPRLSRECTFQGSYVVGKVRSLWPAGVILIGLVISVLAVLGVQA